MVLLSFSVDVIHAAELFSASAEHLMTRADEFPNDGRADEAGGTSYEYRHGSSS